MCSSLRCPRCCKETVGEWEARGFPGSLSRAGWDCGARQGGGASAAAAAPPACARPSAVCCHTPALRNRWSQRWLWLSLTSGCHRALHRAQAAPHEPLPARAGHGLRSAAPGGGCAAPGGAPAAEPRLRTHSVSHSFSHTLTQSLTHSVTPRSPPGTAPMSAPGGIAVGARGHLWPPAPRPDCAQRRTTRTRSPVS